jgi:hypothetical protein
LSTLVTLVYGIGGLVNFAPIVGVLLFVAALSPAARPVAIFAGFVSMLSFIGLVWTMEEANAALTRVMWIDVVAILLLALAWCLDKLAPTAS